ncbi:hypothetical protein [Actinomadura rudentiformis]|uniref:Uncharacterized protein n=1 Tax=Actinomadura rudentiformis TaxID=359158 RepID=A0A6H9YT39_9ACTN|nr:hypothetical protein [Actinomadura rudentiformis]KAB2347330.1 hypothetical protein F8566_20170 [Actinomadura rudentiformis]
MAANLSTATCQAWRVQPADGLAIRVDAWHTIQLASAGSRPRVDLIAERVVDGQRYYRAIEGTLGSLAGRPVTPEGWTAIAAVTIPAWISAVFPALISEAD